MRSKILPEYCTCGRDLVELGGVIVHYFSAKNVDWEKRFDLETCRRLFLDLNRPKKEREWFMHEDNWPDSRMYASAHLLIGRDGETWRLVEYGKQAYHAGASILNGRNSCNRWTLGIDLMGTVDSGFTQAQYAVLAELLNGLDVPMSNVAGHDTVRWAAIQAGSKKRPRYDPSGRKDGRGDNLDWTYLKELVQKGENSPHSRRLAST